MIVQFWKVSGYEATADIDDEPVEGGVLHRGTNTDDGATVWVIRDDSLNRWQEIDPSMSAQGYPSDDVTPLG